MKILVILELGLASLAFSQAKAPVGQQAGDCSLNITGNSNSASLVCNGLDPKLAEQVRAILNGTRRNEKAAKEISQKLDLILKEIDRQTLHIEQHSEGPNSPNTVNIVPVPPQRSLSDEQKQRLLEELKKGPRYEFIARHSPNLESQNYEEQISSVLIKAGWIRARTPFKIIERDAPGIFISVHKMETAPPGAIALQQALKAIGIDAPGVASESDAEGRFELYVGPNQPTAQIPGTPLSPSAPFHDATKPSHSPSL